MFNLNLVHEFKLTFELLLFILDYLKWAPFNTSVFAF